MALDDKRDKIRPLRSATPDTRPNPAEMLPGELFINYTDRVISLRDEETAKLREIAGLEPEYRDLLVTNKVFIPKAGVVDEITYNVAPFVTTENVINISDISPCAIQVDNINKNVTVNIRGNKYTNKIIKILFSKDESVLDDIVITWNGVTSWLSDDNAAPRWGKGHTQSDLIVAIFITEDLVVCNTIFNTENPVMSGSAFINWGQIKGNIENQKDLKYLLDQKLESTDAADIYVTKVNAQVTDKITVGV